MATNIPPHNLGEVVRATMLLIENPGVTVEELMELVPGPDFPTGAQIFGRLGILQAYKTGRGSLTIRARTEVERVPGTDREQIVVTEIPYQVNKARLHAKIGELVRDKRIDGVRDSRDESDRDGMRLVIELRKDVYPQVVLNQLFRLTDMQASFGIINLAIVAGRPEVLDLKRTLELFVDHRREVVTRRTRFLLAKAEGQREIVEGLGMVTTDTDRVIKTIREARDPDQARANLMELELAGLDEFVRRAGRPEAELLKARERSPYRLSERQARAILEMRLARLTGLEREKLAREYTELCEEITRLAAILADEKLLMKVIVDELREIEQRYASPRRTEIVDDEAEIQLEDLIQQEEMVVTISHEGYIKRTPLATYRAQRRGGKGKSGMEARTDDFVTQLFITSTHSLVFFFSNRGKVYVKKVYEIPLAARSAKGRAIVNFIGIEPGDRVAAITPVRGFEEGLYVITLTRGGTIKKTSVLDYQNYREKGIIGVKINEDDALLGAEITDGSREVLIATKRGQSIRFDEKQVRAMGRNAAGVKGIELEEGDEVVGLAVTEPERSFVLAVCERGYGKRTPLEEFRAQNRGGKGVILIDASDRNGPVVGIALVKPSDEVMLITDRGQTLRTRVDEIRETGRNAQGVKIMAVEEGERVVAIEPAGESRASAELDADLAPGVPEGETPGAPPDEPAPPGGNEEPPAAGGNGAATGGGSGSSGGEGE
jgi:DNA gyrase subunit A